MKNIQYYFFAFILLVFFALPAGAIEMNLTKDQIEEAIATGEAHADPSKKTDTFIQPSVAK